MENKHTPELVERKQWTNDPNNFTDLLDWGKGKIGSASPLVWEGHKVDSFTLQVSTPKGWVLAPLNTWIVKIGDSFFIENNDQWIEDILATTPSLFQHYVKALQQAVSKYNALSGIEDPEKWVEDMKAENQRLKEEVAKLTKMYTDNEGFTRRIAKELRELKASKP